jgi:hypothetical protein
LERGGHGNLCRRLLRIGGATAVCFERDPLAEPLAVVVAKVEELDPGAMRARGGGPDDADGDFDRVGEAAEEEGNAADEILDESEGSGDEEAVFAEIQEHAEVAVAKGDADESRRRNAGIEAPFGEGFGGAGAFYWSEHHKLLAIATRRGAEQHLRNESAGAAQVD